MLHLNIVRDLLIKLGLLEITEDLTMCTGDDQNKDKHIPKLPLVPEGGFFLLWMFLSVASCFTKILI